jgi:lysophospholipase L1-like esterase/fibronectin type 3 domain-containing protein
MLKLRRIRQMVLLVFLFTLVAFNVRAVNVTFQVDMTYRTVSPNGIHLAGSFQGWSPSATLMTNAGGNIYAITIDIAAGTAIQYKFLNGNAWGADEIISGSCATSTNRTFTVPSSNVTLPLVCFASCSNVCTPVKYVACIGNSITAGAGVSDPASQSYPAQLRTSLGTGFEVGNFGHSGATMLKNGDTPYWNQAEYPAAKASNPDVVVIKLGTNDSKSWNWGSFGSQYPGDYRSMIDAFRALPSKPKIFICLPSKAFSTQYAIDENVLANNIRPAIVQVAKDKGVSIIDVYDATKNASANFPDGIHPDATGAGLIAAKVKSLITYTPPTITRSGNVLQAVAASAYQWYFNGDTIPKVNGGRNQSYTATQSGVYAVGLKLNSTTQDRVMSADLNVTVGTTTPPSPPTGLSAVAGNTQITLSWTASSGATSYNVKRSTVSGGPYTTLATGITATTYTNTGLTNGTVYYYVVSAVNTAGESANSNQASATPVLTTINAFNQIEAESYSTMSGIQSEACSDTGGGSDVGYTDSNDYIVFNNIDFGSGPTGLDVRIASAATFTGTAEFRLASITGTLIGTVSFGTTGGWQTWVTKTISVSGASGIKNLYIVFQGGNGIGNVNWFKFKTLSPPPAPTNLTATAGNAQVTLNWTASSGATSYTIRRSSTAGGPYSDIATGVTTTSYTNTALTNGTTYYFVVAAVGAAGTSGNSNQASATPAGATTLSNGVYKITARNSGKALDVVGVSTTNGARIQQWDWADGSNQKWKVESLGSGLYKITAMHSLKSLDVVDASLGNGAQIQQWDFSNNTNQKWTIENLGTGYYKLIASHSNKVLTVPGASITNGTLITQSDWTSGTEQQWQFTFLSAARESLNEEVQQNDPNNFVTVFPTLVKSELNIDYYSSISQTLHISMVNVQGSVKQKESFVLNKGLNRIKLDVNALDSGLYLVNTQTQSNGKASKKVIVIK